LAQAFGKFPYSATKPMWQLTKWVLVALAALPGAIAQIGSPTSVWDADAALNAALQGSGAAPSVQSVPTARTASVGERVVSDEGKPFSRLALSKVWHSVHKSHKSEMSQVSNFVIDRSKTPKQLAGYLGWATPQASSSFSTHWKTKKNTGAPLDTRSDYIRTLEDGRPEPTARAPEIQKQALIKATAVTSHGNPFIDMPDMNWGGVAAKSVPKTSHAALATKRTKTSQENPYLASVGWTAPSAHFGVPDSNPYLDSLTGQSEKKKFLAVVDKATEVVKAKRGPPNKFLNEVIPESLQ